jgi:hypothetical protein
MAHVRGEVANLHNLPQMRDVLKVARIMPAEKAVAFRVD